MGRHLVDITQSTLPPCYYNLISNIMCAIAFENNVVKLYLKSQLVVIRGTAMRRTKTNKDNAIHIVEKDLELDHEVDWSQNVGHKWEVQSRARTSLFTFLKWLWIGPWSRLISKRGILSGETSRSKANVIHSRYDPQMQTSNVSPQINPWT